MLPTVHEGSAVRQMEGKGTSTDKGDFNRWIKAANHLLRDIRKKITVLTDWLKIVKDELKKSSDPSIVDLLSNYCTTQNAGAWSNKAKVGNLKHFVEAVNYLTENHLFTLDELENLLRYAELYRELKPVYDELNSIRWKSRRAKFDVEHKKELKIFSLARRKLEVQRSPVGKIPVQTWQQEMETLQQEYEAANERYKPLRDDLTKLLRVKNCVDTVLRQKEQRPGKQQELER